MLLSDNHAASAAAFFFSRQRKRPAPPRPVVNSWKAVGLAPQRSLRIGDLESIQWNMAPSPNSIIGNTSPMIT
jgi:hypothetical protein